MFSILRSLILSAKPTLTEGSTKTRIKKQGASTRPTSPPAPIPKDTNGK